MPRCSSAVRAIPIGISAGHRDRDDERKHRGDHSDVQATCRGQPVQLTTLHPQCVQHVVVTRFCIRLAKESLRDDEEQCERHQERDQTKSDGLCPNRGLDLRLLQFAGSR